MSDFFEKLQKIAKEQFGCTLVQIERKRDFKTLFGFGIDDVAAFDNDFVMPTPDVAMYRPAVAQLKHKEMEDFEMDMNEISFVFMAA